MTTRPFDPNAAAPEGAGIFGLPFTQDEARVHLIPVPFEATTSYGGGTAGGPAAILAASAQVDLLDVDTGKPYEAGIVMLDAVPAVARLNKSAKKAAQTIIATGGVVDDDAAARRALAAVNAAGDQINEIVYEETVRALDEGRLVGVVGGDHSVPFGAIRAFAERHPGMGILHVDAHADLRVAYEGFTWSHASIMHNVHERIDGVKRIVQVGIRDFCEQEFEFIRARASRVKTFFDRDVAHSRFGGEAFSSVVRRIVRELPRLVYVSFDIDGLDPTLCPSTGTPVPGGLSFQEAVFLLDAVVRSGRTIVGFDLCEVTPGQDGEWDANVGARILYKLVGFMVKTARPAKLRK